jgi:uncharacterized membrane protein
MKRLKLKYSKQETKNDLYTFGKEWQLEDGTEYIGTYHQYTATNETYTESSWNASLSKPLFEYHDQTSINTLYRKLNNAKTKFDHVRDHHVIITKKDVQLGSITRFFLKKANETLIIEISPETAQQYVALKIDNVQYTLGSLKWKITGPIDTVNTNISIPGVFDENSKAIKQLEQTLPGLSNKLNNPLEFYTDTDFVVPADINGLDS